MKNKEAIIENLKRKFAAVKEHLRSGRFIHFSLEYIDFICESDELAPLVKKLIIEGKLPPRTLQPIYNNFINLPYIRDYNDDRFNHVQFPKFFDREIENNFNLHRDFCRAFKNDYKTTLKNPKLIRIDPNQKCCFAGYSDIQTLHNGLLELLELSGEKTPRISGKRLNFYPDTGEAEYLTAIWQFKGKARAFLTVLHENKNMNFNVEGIREHCNPLIEIEKHKFKGEKDINDTLREIKYRLKANKGEFFPIFKQEKGWIWLEK